MIPRTKAEKAIYMVSELNRLCFALRKAGRRGRVERMAARNMVRENPATYAGDRSHTAKK